MVSMLCRFWKFREIIVVELILLWLFLLKRNVSLCGCSML